MPKANRNKEDTMTKGLRPDLCSANRRSLCKMASGSSGSVLRAWLWGRYWSKGSPLARGRMYHFHPKAAWDRLGNNALRYAGHRLGRGGSSQQGWVWQTFLVGGPHVFLAVGFKHWRLMVLIHLRTVGISEVSEGLWRSGLGLSCFV